MPETEQKNNTADQPTLQHLTRKRTAALSSFTRSFNAAERMTKKDTSPEVVRKAVEEVERRYGDLEGICNEIVVQVGEGADELKKCDDFLDEKYDLLSALQIRSSTKMNEVNTSADSIQHISRLM